MQTEGDHILFPLTLKVKDKLKTNKEKERLR